MILLELLLQGRVEHTDRLVPGKGMQNAPKCNSIQKLNPGNQSKLEGKTNHKDPRARIQLRQSHTGS